MKTADEETQVITIPLILKKTQPKKQRIPPTPNFDKEAVSSQKIRARFCQKIEKYV